MKDKLRTKDEVRKTKDWDEPFGALPPNVKCFIETKTGKTEFLLSLDETEKNG